jgi:hypothetical protein
MKSGSFRLRAGEERELGSWHLFAVGAPLFNATLNLSLSAE